jgi:hypothetical protein
MLPFLLGHLSALLPAIPRILKGTFAVQSQHSSGQPRDISQFSVTQISSNPVCLSFSIDPHTITANFSQDGRSGVVECLGASTPFAFDVSAPFFSASLSLPQNATACLSILSHSAFHFVFIQNGTVHTFTFEKKVTFSERVLPFLNWRLFVTISASLFLAFAVRRRKPQPKPKTD